MKFAEDNTGELIAFRCSGETNWQLIRLGHDQRHFFECKTSLVGDAPDFSKLESLTDAAPAIVGCLRDPQAGDTRTAEGKATYADLATELEVAGGEAAAVRMLADTQESKLPEDWTDAALALSPAGRTDLEKRICPVLAAPVSTMFAYERAARLCSYDVPGAGDGALARVRTLFTLPVPSPDDVTKHREGVEWWLLVAAHTHLVEAGEAACAFVSGSDDVTMGHDAMLLIAASKVKCPIVADAVACGKTVECEEDRTCTAKEAWAPISKWLGRATLVSSGVRELPKRPSDAMIGLVAAYAQGPLTKTFALRRARRTYTVSSGSGPSCSDHLDAGAPCTCASVPGEEDLCNAPRDGGLLVVRECAFHIDDKRHALSDVRHVCALKSEGCSNDDACCAGLHCIADDARVDHCE